MLHRLKLAWRRGLRKRQRQVGAVAGQSGDGFERYFIGRLNKFSKVWRFMTAWILLFVLLIGCLVAQNQALTGYYQSRKPVAGGVYTEGILGTFTNANPLYATNDVDKTVSSLVFAGLFKYDDSNQLVGDLASGWTVDTTGKIYTVKLRHGLTWQDGKPLTAQDVAFTYKVVQNPDAESPLRSSWADIAVTASDRYTIKFTLPNPLSSFLYGLTNGIVPQHLLAKVPMAGMRSISFNTQSPVGAGPFAWQSISVSGNSTDNAQETIGLTAFAGYHGGPAKLKSFVVHSFASKSDMIAAYKKNALTAMTGLQSVPAGLDSDSVARSFPLTAATMVFFRNTAGILQDVKVRQALVLAASPASIIRHLGYSARPVNEALLAGQLGYDRQFAEKTDDLTLAQQTLDGDGWPMGTDGYRSKNGQRLNFNLTIANTAEYASVAHQLQQQWRKLGVDATVSKLDDDSFRSSLSGHTYDAVLYGIAIGADPDVFVYWDSTQADIRSSNRLNLSEYKSPAVDDALEAGRTRNDPALRVIKYRAFLQQWQQDDPALGLYQPRYLYISHLPIYNLNEHTINEASDRLDSVTAWMIRTARVTNN